MCFVERAVRIKQIQVLSSHTRTMPLSLAEVKTSLTGSYWGRDKGVVKQNKIKQLVFFTVVQSGVFKESKVCVRDKSDSVMVEGGKGALV